MSQDLWGISRAQEAWCQIERSRFMLLPSYEINKIGDQMHSMLLYNYQYCIIYLNVFKRVDLKCYHHLREKKMVIMWKEDVHKPYVVIICIIYMYLISTLSTFSSQMLLSQQYLNKAGLEGEDPCRAEKAAGLAMAGSWSVPGACLSSNNKGLCQPAGCCLARTSPPFLGNWASAPHCNQRASTENTCVLLYPQTLLLFLD